MLELCTHDLDEEVALRREVVVEQPAGDACGGRDLLDPDLVVRPLGEQLGADLHELLAALVYVETRARAVLARGIGRRALRAPDSSLAR